jgi:hypothetical protein
MAPRGVAAPVVKLIVNSCVGPPESELNEAKATPLSDEMSKPARPLGSTPSDPTVKSCPVFGDTGVAAPATVPCVTSAFRLESIP